MNDCLIYTIGNNWECMFPNGLDSFHTLGANNYMKLNILKSKLNHRLSELNIENKFVLNDTPLQNVCEYYYLGIILDSKMTLSLIFVKVKKIVSNKMYVLIKIRNNIEMLISGNISDRDELQKLQNNALRVC